MLASDSSSALNQNQVCVEKYIFLYMCRYLNIWCVCTHTDGSRPAGLSLCIPSSSVKEALGACLALDGWDLKARHILCIYACLATLLLAQAETRSLWPSLRVLSICVAWMNLGRPMGVAEQWCRSPILLAEHLCACPKRKTRQT